MGWWRPSARHPAGLPRSRRLGTRAHQRARRRRGGRDRAHGRQLARPEATARHPAQQRARRCQVLATEHGAAQLITRAVKPAPRPGSRRACPRAGARHPSPTTSTPSPSSVETARVAASWPTELPQLGRRPTVQRGAVEVVATVRVAAVWPVSSRGWRARLSTKAMMSTPSSRRGRTAASAAPTPLTSAGALRCGRCRGGHRPQPPSELGVR